MTERTAKQQPWLMRTYAGHTTARASNELYRKNLAKGQTGLSIAFDLPTQIGYDSDHPLARAEVGKVGVPVTHIDDMRTLLAEIPLDQMNTSMTINATAAWLLSLYVAVAEERGASPTLLQGTTQNDILKEYLSRGTWVFPPQASLRLIGDMIGYTVDAMPKWNPTNICSYHLQEAGATPVLEVAYALANAIAVLDTVKARGVDHETMERIVGRISFFVNAGIRFIEEMSKLRAFGELWDEIAADRYGVRNEKMRRFRYGVQVNSLGLTAMQPENNVARILYEMLGVTLSKNARARAVQLPAWNEALGLPRPWDQQWSLRCQQILAYETDILEYEDLFDGNPVVAAKVAAIKAGTKAEIDEIEALGGTLNAIEHMKEKLVAANAARIRRIERGEDILVGVNRWTEAEPSPLGGAGSILTVDPADVQEQLDRLDAFRAKRAAGAVADALRALEDAARGSDNIMGPSIVAAKAGVTTGEWTDTLRRVFGEYRPPTGIDHVALSGGDAAIDALRARVRRLGEALGRPPKLLIGKPGLDGHSNGAEQIAVRARDVGFEVVYQGIRLSPDEIVRAAVEEGVHAVGLSILSGSHDTLVPEVLDGLRDAGLADVPVFIGGIIPDADAETLRTAGVVAVYTPKDFDLNRIMASILDLLDARHAPSA